MAQAFTSVTFHGNRTSDDAAAQLPLRPPQKTMAVKQRADDRHAQMPTHEQVQEVRLEVTGYQNRIVELERHKSEGGFGLDASAPQVQSERCGLERAEKELARLTVAGAFVADAAMTEHAPSGLIGTGGVSGPPVSLAQDGAVRSAPRRGHPGHRVSRRGGPECRRRHLAPPR